MRIQDKFHPDGISYESGDELSENETDLRSSQDRSSTNGSFSSTSSLDPFRKSMVYSIKLSLFLSFLFTANRYGSKKYPYGISPHLPNTNVFSNFNAIIESCLLEFVEYF